MQPFDPTQTVVTDGYVLFWQPPSVFGQWTYSELTVEGGFYTCAEQYMMAEKAALFGDHSARRQIMATQDPRTHKALGQKVEGFSDKVWIPARLDIVVRGNLAKFGQNPAMHAELWATGDRVLVEASPMDRIWGLGSRADDPRATKPAQWRGQNLLGEALTVVRDRLGVPR